MDKFGMWEWKTGYVQLLQDWSEWLSSHYNWRNFHFLVIEYEDECCMGNREWVLYVLGIGVRICWVYNTKAKTRVLVEERMMQIKAHPDLAKDIDDVIKDLRS